MVKQKLIIINAMIFPVPAVKGGAVETLLETFIKQADTDSELEITVVSLADPEAVRISRSYPNIRFIWLPRSQLLDRVDQGITKLLRKIKRDPNLWQKNYLWQLQVKKQVQAILQEQSFDLVLVENAMFLMKLFEKRELAQKYEQKVIFHSHNVHFRQLAPIQALAGVINVSHFLEENSRSCFGRDVTMQVVYNGLDSSLFQKQISHQKLEALRDKWEIPASSPILVFVGRILPKKGVGELIQAFERLNHPEAHLLLVGASSFGMKEETAFEREVAERIRGNSRIHATGFVPHHELGKYYALADVVVLPSIWEEPLGLTMIEAQMAGRPLITTSQGGIPETSHTENSLILDLGPNFVVDLAQAMEQVLSHPATWEEKAKEAQKWALSNFNEEAYYKNMKQALFNFDKRKGPETH